MNYTHFGQCDECKNFAMLPHKCPPRFGWRVDELDDWETTYAYDEQQAAIQAAEVYDQEDYHLIAHSEATTSISIRDERTGEITQWLASGESVPQYHARKA